MNRRQKIVQQQFLQNEEAVIRKLKQVYNQSLKDIEKRAQTLQDDINRLGTLAKLSVNEEEKAKLLSMQQSKIYQKQYQDAMKKQVGSILDNMQVEEFKTVDEYLRKCYEDGFVGTMFDLQGQGIPLCFPLDQEAMVRAAQLDSKISQGLYSRLGEDVTILKKKITAQVSRGISTGMSFQQVAKQLAGCTNIGFNNAVRIARTEGHRIQVQSSMDACYKAKEKGADVVKQWDATLDNRTRESHARVDGEIREIDEKFSNGLMFPGDPSGGAAEVVNCRCALLQRARWALDEAELQVLEDRAKFFDLDKTKNFEEFRETYLQAASSSHYLPISERTVPIVRSSTEFDEYIKKNDLKPIYRGYSADSDEQLAEYFEQHKLGTAPESGARSSALGKGVYFADDKSEAEGYMRRRGAEKSQSSGKVMTAALDVDAKIGNYNELERLKQREQDDYLNKARNAESKEEKRKLKDKYYDLVDMSFDEYVRELDYDAIYDPGTGYTVVIKQKALVIRDD